MTEKIGNKNHQLILVLLLVPQIKTKKPSGSRDTAAQGLPGRGRKKELPRKPPSTSETDMEIRGNLLGLRSEGKSNRRYHRGQSLDKGSLPRESPNFEKRKNVDPNTEAT